MIVGAQKLFDDAAGVNAAADCELAAAVVDRSS
jgi:hypothetical protein